MSNVVIAGTPPSGDSALPVALSVDRATDYLPIYTASATATQAITPNVLLGITGAPVGTSDSQTLTNKTLTSPTISSPTLSGTLAGTYTIGGTPTFPSSVVQLTTTQTLTNKTLTTPTITSPTITNATISADTLTGYTVSNNGTVYGIAVTGGTIGSAALAANSVLTAAISDNNVTASKLATNAIKLGYAQITAGSTTTSATPVSVGLSATVTIPAGGRSVKITALIPRVYNSAVAENKLSIWDGALNTGTQIAQGQSTSAAASEPDTVMCMAIVTPSAGSKTYNIGIATSTGTLTYDCASTYPGFILVEVI